MPEPSAETVALVRELIVAQMRAGKSLGQACDTVRKLCGDAAAVEVARAQHVEEAERKRTLLDPQAIYDRDDIHEAWYQGPGGGDRAWPRLVDGMASQGLPEPAIESIDDVSTSIVGLLDPPFERRIRTRGLVVGYVQSGKTSNFTAVIAKAADAGYRLFIILTGMYENLRSQTQARLDKSLTGMDEATWAKLTTVDNDFVRPLSPPTMLLNSITLNEVDHPIKTLCVTKKNAFRLNALAQWLESASDEVLNGCPVLIIDDEADQASVNTKKDRDTRTAINKAIIRLLTLTPSDAGPEDARGRCAYIGYTATPFANVFIDPTAEEDLYPRHFIVDLPKPVGYFGPEQIFGREPLSEGDEDIDGYDLIRHIPASEIEDLVPKRGEADEFGPSVSDSLADAVAYFILATAARRARGDDDHSTMLLHTTAATPAHFRFQEVLGEHVGGIVSAWNQQDADLVQALKDQWAEETSRVADTDLVDTVTNWAAKVAWDQIEPEIEGVLSSLRCVVDNYFSTDRLDYDTAPQVVIVIGGNTLSRGLTLEGLVVSFFARRPGAGDTLLQMGRWFGYRRGYEDLPRIWTTQELEELFRHLAIVEAEIRGEFTRYNEPGTTPMTYATRIRTHPQLAITSAMKMRHARPVSLSFSGRRLQTILFNHRDESWLRRNAEAARRLVVDAGSLGSPVDQGHGRQVLYRIPTELILAFLREYQVHERAVEFKLPLVRDYIERQAGAGRIEHWNVAVMSRARDTLGTFDIGFPDPVNLINRARLNNDRDYADIKALMSHTDRVIDVDVDHEQIAGATAERLQQLRSSSVGLLLLYPIGANSQPTGKKTRRLPLDAAMDVIGLGLVFPTINDGSRPEAEYYAVELPEVSATEEDVEDGEPTLADIEEAEAKRAAEQGDN